MIAEIASQLHDLKMNQMSAAYSLEKPEPLFFLKDGKPLPVPDEHAPEFSAHGLMRGPVTFRGHAQPFPMKGTPPLLLRLRSLRLAIE